MRRRHTNFGFSSILISFTMICFVTFFALSLLTANADYKLSKKVAERNTHYYQAKELAYETLASVDQTLEACFLDAQDSAHYYANAREALSEGSWEEDSQGTLLYRYQIPVGESQMLTVTLEPTYPLSQSSNYYTIVGLETVTMTD